MKVCAIADQHGFLPDIPPCDLLVIAGDICPHVGAVDDIKFGKKVRVRVPAGSSDDLFFQHQWLIREFSEWLEKVPAKEIAACWGNHDYIGEKIHLKGTISLPSSMRWHIHTDEGIELLGKKIWLTPWQLNFYDWAFNAPSGDEGEEFLDRKFSQIPEDTDIIVVHGPPYGYGDAVGDRITGSHALLKNVKRGKPNLVAFGHIHCGRGLWELETGNQPPTLLANCTVVDEAYKLVFPPMIFDL